MRAFAQIVPTFWTRGSGKKLRGKKDAQILAFYLMTSPASNLIGIYYEPFVQICHETGLLPEEAREAFPKILEIAQYDDDAELVWVPNMARIQIGVTLRANDKRRQSVIRELALIGKHQFARAFLELYGESYGLPVEGLTQFADAPSKGLPGGGEGPFPDPSPPPVPVSDPEATEGEEVTGKRAREPRSRPEFRAFEESFATDVEAWAGPSPERIDQASRAGLDLAEEQTKFLARMRGDGKTSCNWDAEFELWLTRSVRFRRQDEQRGRVGARAPAVQRGGYSAAERVKREADGQ